MKTNKLKTTGKYFSRSQLLLLSELTPSQFKAIYDSQMLLKEQISPDYQLYEVVFCRLVSLLRKEFTLQTIRDNILDSCECYEDDILYSNYALISLDTGFPESLVFCQINDSNFREHLKGKLMCIDRKTDYTVDGKKIHSYNVWINLLEILTDMVNRAIDFDFDNIELKFADFLSQSSVKLTV